MGRFTLYLSIKRLLKNLELNTKQQYLSLQSHSRESGNPGKSTGYWMPVFTGMTSSTRSEYDERLFQQPVRRRRGM